MNRGLLNPTDSESKPPGSPWWRAVNDRLLGDGCESVALSGDLAGDPSSPAVAHWLRFVEDPTARSWYRAHNASIVGAYLDNGDLAAAESEVERFFLNVVLLRVLYAHALVAAPRLSLGRFAPLGMILGDPRLGMAGAFLSLGRVLPNRYPAEGAVDDYIELERGVGRLLDYGVIGPRLQLLYEWSASELEEPALLGLVRDGAPIYAWPFAERRVWRPARPSAAMRLLRRVTAPHLADSKPGA